MTVRSAILCVLVAVGCGDRRDAPSAGPDRGSAATHASERDRPDAIVLPRVARHGYEPLHDADELVIALSREAVSVDGKPIAKLSEQGSIARLGTYIAAHAAARPDKMLPRIAIAADRELPCRLLVQTMRSIVRVGVSHVRVMALAGDDQVAAPIAIPQRSSASPANQSGGGELAARTGSVPVTTGMNLGVTVSITSREIVVWSTSGRRDAAATISRSSADMLTELGAILDEMVARGEPGDRAAVLTADPATPMQVIAEVLGAIRADPRAPRFVDVVLASDSE
jgi:hypothetical protein